MSTQKKIRVTLQFTIDIDEAAIALGENLDEREYAQRQQRLLHAVLSDQQRLHTYLAYEVASYLEGLEWHAWHQILMGKEAVASWEDQRLAGEAVSESREVLAPSIATLPAADQQFFQDVSNQGYFSENVEEMQDCFSTRLSESEIVVEEDEA